MAAEFTDVLQLSNCSFSGNTALGDNNKGGAVLARLSGDVSVTGSSFSNNSASGEVSAGRQCRAAAAASMHATVCWHRCC